MRLKSRNAIALFVAAAVLVGAGVALAQSQSPSPSGSPGTKQERRSLGRDAFLDDVARRLGIQRSRLDGALTAMALAEVAWAENNGFLTRERADRLRDRINDGKVIGLGRFGLHGLGLGLGVKGSGLRRGFLKGRFRGGFGTLDAAADYLGLPEEDLSDALRTRTLAQVARDRGRSVDGLVAALRAAKKARLDEIVMEGRITAAQENALLRRFDSEIRDAVDGIPPGLTELARRLGMPRRRLIAAIKDAAIAQVDRALARGGISEERAEAIKERIRSSPAWPLGALGPCRGGPGFSGGPWRWRERPRSDRGAIEEIAEL
jgi:DNA-binding phage protein